MTDPEQYVWHRLRERFIERVRDTPSAIQEAAILRVFEADPALVERACEHVASRWEQGVVRAAWPVLVKHVQQAAEQARQSTAPVTDSGSRRKAEAKAEQWLHSSGIHLDREEEVADELFGVRGQLRWWGSDGQLRASMLDLWRQLRPKGLAVEHDAEVRAAAWRVSHKAQLVRLKLAARPGGAAGGVEGSASQTAGRLDPERVMAAIGAPGQEVGLAAAPSGNPFLEEPS